MHEKKSVYIREIVWEREREKKKSMCVHEWMCVSTILLRTHQHWLTSKDIHQYYADTGFSLEDVPKAIDDRDGWHGREPRNSVPALQLDDNNDEWMIMCRCQCTWTLERNKASKTQRQGRKEKRIERKIDGEGVKEIRIQKKRERGGSRDRE